MVHWERVWSSTDTLTSLACQDFGFGAASETLRFAPHRRVFAFREPSRPSAEAALLYLAGGVQTTVSFST